MTIISIVHLTHFYLSSYKPPVFFFPQCNLCVTLSKIVQKFPMNLSVLLPNNQLKEVWDNNIDVKPGHQQRRRTVPNIL